MSNSSNTSNNPLQSVYAWYRGVIRNPKYRWWVILGTLAYVLSPFDLAPDLFPIVGQIDDVALVAILVAELSQIILDYFKSRQGEAASVPGTNQKDAVDVDAVSVK